MAVREVSIVPQLTPALFGRYSVLVALSVVVWSASAGAPLIRTLAVVPQLIVYVRAYAAVWVALEDVTVEEPAELFAPYWLSVAVAVTIGASTASVHVLRLRSPTTLSLTVVALVGVLEAMFGIHEYGTARDVARLRAMILDDEKERGEY
jgi:hypothetical protein